MVVYTGTYCMKTQNLRYCAFHFFLHQKFHKADACVLKKNIYSMHSNMYIRKYFALALQNTQASTTKTGTAPAPAINRTEQKQKQTQYFQRYWVTIPVFSALYIYIYT